MARYVWVILADSPRDGGWVRWGGQFATFADAARFLAFALQLAAGGGSLGDYVGIVVRPTIAFR
jgi:hypothetical protein